MNDMSPIFAYSVLGFGLVSFVVSIFFCLSLFTAMNLVPEENRTMPAWLVWLILIPGFGLIFLWLMVPFGAPNTFKKHFTDNSIAQNQADVLFKVGLAYVICATSAFIPLIGFFAAAGAFVLWIVYWVKIVNFKNTHLVKRSEI